ncbi:hypothetical protein [Burkholderia mallei]|nr:hypothetical protein [Burkholderia mallei]
MKKRFTEQQIIGFLKEAENYLAPSEFAAKHRATADAPAAFQELV